MRLFDRLLTRRRHLPSFGNLPPRVHRRLTLAAHELNEAEKAIAERIGLAEPPRLLIVDEEEAVILAPADRDTIP